MTAFHAVRFYDSLDSISGIVAAFLGSGFVTSEPAVVIATTPHRAAIARALGTVSFSVGSLQTSRQLLLLDAPEVLATLMVNGTPDPVRFASVIRDAVDAIVTAPSGGFRVYDEMVDLLWSADRRDAAMRLETLWDDATVQGRCSLLCGHAARAVGRDSARQSLCARHSHVIGDNGLPHPLQAR